MSRVVIHGQGEYDVFVGLGPCRGVKCRSRWEPARWVLAGKAVGRQERARRWLWGEIEAGRVTLGELVGLHGRRLGVRVASERWFAELLDGAAMWALAEQARRLEARFAQKVAARRAAALAGGGSDG